MPDIKEVEEVFRRTMAEPVELRDEFLARECAGDEELLNEVRELISFTTNDHSGFLESSAIEEEAKRIACDAPTLEIGSRFGRYQILEFVGAGGMGLVYRARDEEHGRTVALKILMPEFGLDSSRIRRFRREAKSVAALDHPGFPALYELGERRGIHFMAMEWIDGRTLSSKVETDTPMGAKEIIDFALQVAEALSLAHRKGLVHRDIKPSNLMITSNGEVKILDLGLVKPKSEHLSEISTDSLTVEGTIVGTIEYMSPEQVLAKKVDRRTDLFSLGVVMYQMATGRLPHLGKTVQMTMDQIIHSNPIPVARFNLEASNELELVIRKCLAKDREKRYQSAGELIQALRKEKPSLFSKLRGFFRH